MSDLGLHCLPISHKKDAELIWVNPGLRVKCILEKYFFFISQPNHMLWVLKRTVSIRRFF